MYISKCSSQNGRSFEAYKQSDKIFLEKNKDTCYLRQANCTGSFLSVRLVQLELTTNSHKTQVKTQQNIVHLHNGAVRWCCKNNQKNHEKTRGVSGFASVKVDCVTGNHMS